MIIKELNVPEKTLVDIKELREFLRIDSDVFDENLNQSLKAAITEFENRTNRILVKNNYEISFFNERVVLAPFNSLENAQFKAEFKTNSNVLYCEGSGRMIVSLGYDIAPEDIKLWLKNYCLHAFENTNFPNVSKALINRYKITFF
ncbi:head-tail connector protein [Campylobacter insulaenigrae]|uniref:Putative bacteriophage head to tail connecting protein n=1 Tax=Campylobacter insulaenigrae NCTC 12927 TaxID=1031564 RepID=A0A0A8H178_9BACT|nr:head-tail connector protein [Campylobacter insulaenigrae]AJC87796.1 putative bacteriophage head to tail connecting protein [Campylobacter insulaenigrae NCTC 12927]MCR6572976.1 phage gp6-like head-tail connector protein [Campylobacter insulaenigrae]MCR6577442.1 phage gp6-like head-tail connector protein [Campylobacter insulaenigrae]MCR6581595.1 phage gp6-like head-tail connector protein [Campylobacter insulaenigrae]MCR6586530.1 phage gp6-like head-tail connector protein [Campylobacter insula